MMLLYPHASIFVHGFNHQLGSIRRDLNEMKAENLWPARWKLSAQVAIGTVTG